MSEPPPSREQIASDALEIIRREHDIHGTKQITFDGLNTALMNMTKFFLEPTPFDEQIPYQYQVKNQSIFEKSQVIISSALHQVDSVLADMKTKMFQLEKNQQQQVIMPMSNMPQQYLPPLQTPETKEKKSILPSFGKPKNLKPDPNNPYQSSLVLQKKTLDLIENWELVVEWQAEGVEYFEDFDKIAYENYLSTHRVMFRKEVEPNLLRVYSQGLAIVLMKEKELAGIFGSAIMKEIQSDRNVFQP